MKEIPMYYLVSPPDATPAQQMRHALTIARILRIVLRPCPATYRRFAGAFMHISIPGSNHVGKN